MEESTSPVDDLDGLSILVPIDVAKVQIRMVEAVVVKRVELMENIPKELNPLRCWHAIFQVKQCLSRGSVLEKHSV